MPSLAGSKLDKYEVIEEVGHGGMAVVYRGNDSVLKREVAVKVLHAHLSDREESRARLEREALAVAKLRHDNILEIFDYSGPKAEESYIVTEFIHGPTLREWIDESLDPRPAVAALVVHRLCLALTCAHDGGIVHRDIKPENVMIRNGDGCLKLMDFGIAQILDNQKLTLTGQLIGSPAYMAPELISGRPLDRRTDLFSLGILLYQLATGELPFSGRNPHEVLNRIADGDYPAASSVCPLVDRDLEAIIATALATSPDDRYQTVATLATELENYLAETGVPPSTDEIKAYFGDASGYVEELDLRVSKNLMERAKSAARDGHTARAIALLGRVLQIDAEHKAARGMLDRLRRRERRMRQLLVGAGVLAAGGLVAAGIVLVPETSPDALAMGSPREEVPARTTNDAAIPGQDPSLAGTAPLSGGAGKSGDPPGDESRAAEDAEAGGLPATGAEPPPDTGPDAIPAPPRRTPRRTNPPAEPVSTKTSCKVKIANIPSSTARNLKLRIQRREIRITNTTMTVAFTGPKTEVVLASENWSGSAWLSTEACAKGAVTLSGRPRDAAVTFRGLPKDSTVRCIAGCPTDVQKRWQMPSAFASVPVNGPTQLVTLAFKAPGHVPKQIRKNLHPGSNLVKIDGLDRIE